MHLGKKYIVRKPHSKALSQRKTSNRVVMLEAGIKKYWIELQNVSLCTLFCVVMLEAGIKKYWIELQNVSLCTLFCIEFKETNLLKWIKVGLRCSLNLLWHRKCHCKVQKIYWSMSFYKFGWSYVVLYTIQNAWFLFCLFCDYWFEIINYITCNIYTHVLQISFMWIKDGFNF